MPSERRSSRPRGLLSAIAWRNLWRNPRRTGLTSGGIGFAVLLMLFAQASQLGSFSIAIENATRLLTGHLQVQHPSYADDPSLRYTVTGASQLAHQIAADPAVLAVGQRAVAFALASVDERSSGAEIMGVEPAAEAVLSTLPASVVEGRYLEAPDEAVIGAGLARNLGAGLADTLIILGSTRDGGVAAMTATVVGIFATGIVDVDRTIVQVPLAAFQTAFELDDEAHMLVVRLDDIDDAAALAAVGDPRWAWLPWQRLLPEIEQTIDLKRASSGIFFALLALLVTFSAFNAFAMTVYERRREFGMLLAIGMRPVGILGMLEVEALWLTSLGVATGVAIGTTLVLVLGVVGIPLGEAGAMLQRFHMPDRMYPALSARILLTGPIIMFAVIPLAALLPALRILRLRPVLALREGP